MWLQSMLQGNGVPIQIHRPRCPSGALPAPSPPQVAVPGALVRMICLRMPLRTRLARQYWAALDSTQLRSDKSSASTELEASGEVQPEQVAQLREALTDDALNAGFPSVGHVCCGFGMGAPPAPPAGGGPSPQQGGEGKDTSKGKDKKPRPPKRPRPDVLGAGAGGPALPAALEDVREEWLRLSVQDMKVCRGLEVELEGVSYSSELASELKVRQRELRDGHNKWKALEAAALDAAAVDALAAQLRPVLLATKRLQVKAQAFLREPAAKKQKKGGRGAEAAAADGPLGGA